MIVNEGLLWMIVNKGPLLTIINKGPLLTIINNMTNFKKTIVFENDRFKNNHFLKTSF